MSSPPSISPTGLRRKASYSPSSTPSNHRWLATDAYRPSRHYAAAAAGKNREEEGDRTSLLMPTAGLSSTREGREEIAALPIDVHCREKEGRETGASSPLVLATATGDVFFSGASLDVVARVARCFRDDFKSPTAERRKKNMKKHK
nr:hypothetical protein Iba_chr14bCG6120 [Ipomoea batatas]